MMLCDYATVADGKLQINGGGWNNISGPTPFVIALLIQVPQEGLGTEHKFSLNLLDQNGLPIALSGPDGVGSVSMQGDFKVEKSADAPVNVAPPVLPMTFGIGQLPLQPGLQYKWQLEIDGEQRDDWSLQFSTAEASNWNQQS